jgi:L-lactate dehydrogenase complex protein LldE
MNMNVSLFIPCFVDQLFPATAFNMVKVLERLGCTVNYNPNITCCGQPAFNAGFRADCRPVAAKFMADLGGTEYIVAPSGSCVGFVRNYYAQVLGPDRGEAVNFGRRLFEFTEFLTDVLKVTDVGAVRQGIATYHDACGALRECRIKEAPRKLLARVRGLELREAADCETCCGFGGTFAVKYEAISIGMGEQKVLNAMHTGAEMIISTDWSCLMHLDGYIRKKGYPIKALHIADVLASGW